jgi:hypothetical protein
MYNSFIFTDFDSLSLSIANKAYNVTSEHRNWDLILDALKANDFDAIPALINETKAIEAFVKTGLSNIEVNVEYGTITYGGVPLHTVIVDHIFRLKDEGFDINPMVKFLDNLMSNPSNRAVNELYGFLQYGKLPITEDGHFLAYKRVRDDYKSVHDGETDNSIGAIVKMPRNLVNENSEQTCSTGLHFCSFEYLKSFSGARIVVLKVNPRDVVSIPADYNNTKGRACEYLVVGELSVDEFNEALNRNVFTEAVRSETGAKVELKQAKDLAPTGPKVGPNDSPFYQGYIKGYNDNSADYEFDSANGFYGDCDDAYCEGYDKGWDDAYEGGSRRYTTQAELDRITAEDDAALDWCKPKVFVDGYRTGYKDGRNRDQKILSGVSTDYNSGYELGYADGKGHKSKQY